MKATKGTPSKDRKAGEEAKKNNATEDQRKTFQQVIGR